MGLVFYYLFHYLFFFRLCLLLLLFLSGLKVNINQQLHLCCVPLFILQSYAAALLSEEIHLQCSADTCGLFMEVLAVVLCDMLALHSCWSQCDITQQLFHFKMPFCADLLLRESPLLLFLYFFLLLFFLTAVFVLFVSCSRPGMDAFVHLYVKLAPSRKLI